MAQVIRIRAAGVAHARLRELADRWVREHAHDHATGRGIATVRRGSRIVAVLTGEAEGERVPQLAAGTGTGLVHVRNPSGRGVRSTAWSQTLTVRGPPPRSVRRNTARKRTRSSSMANGWDT
ncbi:hypothetical protein [Streptomyces sp. NPDC056160]|uniref:hypothetical protein n=1 Tax=Streptomyces sp. NPDC056160 TaxID=3345731 RepID=UPI0035DFB9F3